MGEINVYSLVYYLNSENEDLGVLYPTDIPKKESEESVQKVSDNQVMKQWK